LVHIVVFNLIDAALPGQQGIGLDLPDIFDDDMGAEFLLPVFLVGEHLMGFHFLVDLLFQIYLFAVLHLHLVLLPVQDANQIFPLHRLEHAVEILGRLEPHAEGVRQVGFSQAVFGEQGDPFYFLSH
jgi:hypothetical protein